MKTYQINFNGRSVGAIGLTYPRTMRVKAKSEHKAILKVYEVFEHLSNIKIIEVR